VGLVGSSQVADARFLRRIMVVLVVLTIAAGAMAGLTTYASFAQTSGPCQVTGSICAN
jgi:heme A synthase